MIGKQLAKKRQDVAGVNYLRDWNGSIVVKPEMVRKIWKEYMEHLLHVEKVWDGIIDDRIVEGSCSGRREEDDEDL